MWAPRSISRKKSQKENSPWKPGKRTWYHFWGHVPPHFGAQWTHLRFAFLFPRKEEVVREEWKKVESFSYLQGMSVFIHYSDLGDSLFFRYCINMFRDAFILCGVFFFLVCAQPLSPSSRLSSAKPGKGLRTKIENGKNPRSNLVPAGEDSVWEPDGRTGCGRILCFLKISLAF